MSKANSQKRDSLYASESFFNMVELHYLLTATFKETFVLSLDFFLVMYR